MLTEGARGFPHLSSMTKLVTTMKQWLQWHRVDAHDRLCLITLPIAVPTVTTTSPPSGDNAGASGAYFMMYRVCICMLPLSTSSNLPSSQSGLITGVVLGGPGRIYRVMRAACCCCRHWRQTYRIAGNFRDVQILFCAISSWFRCLIFILSILHRKTRPS